MEIKELTLTDRLMVELGISSDDSEKLSLLENVLWQAGELIKNKRRTKIVEPRYESIQFQLALRLWNIRGIEGESSHIENGITRQYSDDVISDLMQRIIPRAITGD